MASQISFTQAKELTEKVFTSSAPAIEMTKLPIDNIVFGKLNDIPLLEMLVNLDIITKEHISGTVYDKAIYQMVMRIINGKLLMRGQDLVERPDAYAWKTSKVLKEKNKKNLGFHSTEGALTYAELIKTINEPHEKELFTDLLVKWNSDLLLIHTDAEPRKIITVSRKIIELGITEVPNSYDMEKALETETNVTLTPIHEGDALVVEQCSFGSAFYVIQRAEFELTHVPA